MATNTTWEGNQGLLRVYTNAVNADDVIQATLSLSGDSRFDELRYIIGDWSLVEEISMTPDDITKIVHFVETVAKCNPRIRHAIVLPQGEAYQVLGSLYEWETIHLPWTIKVFRTLEQARSWINEENQAL